MKILSSICGPGASAKACREATVQGRPGGKIAAIPYGPAVLAATLGRKAGPQGWGRKAGKGRRMCGDPAEASPLRLLLPRRRVTAAGGFEIFGGVSPRRLRHEAVASRRISSGVKVRERVRKRCSLPFSSENIPPRPGTTSMINWVWLHTANCEALI